MLTCSTTQTDAAKYAADLLVLFVDKKGQLGAVGNTLDDASDGQLSDQIKLQPGLDKAGANVILTAISGIKAPRVLVVSTGKTAALNESAWREVIRQTTNTIVAAKASKALLCLSDLQIDEQGLQWMARETIMAAGDATYQFEDHKSKPSPKPALKKLVLFGASAQDRQSLKAGCKQGKSIAEGIKLTKDLGNMPGNVCTPSFLANTAKDMGKEFDKLKVKILSEKEMEKLGMGALLSVSRGSRQAAKMVIFEYNGGNKNDAPIAMVGKGVTFDSGGISIKPGAAMDEMKYDMCGAASVFGAMQICADLKLPINVIGICPATENLPDGDASKPGDIVTSMSGQTIEVMNTDAEGRLILCDALTYVGRYEPEVVIDMATLTGACIVALGHHKAGVLGNDQELVDELLASGESAGDAAWQLPLGDEYDKQVDSPFADMQNIGGRGAGTITAACFLGRFTKEYRWAHLDIAGVAWRSAGPKCATGRPVPLLMDFLMSKANG